MFMSLATEANSVTHYTILMCAGVLVCWCAGVLFQVMASLRVTSTVGRVVYSDYH